MAARTGNMNDGKPWAEIDLVRDGDTYIVRIEPQPPYRRNRTDELLCNITWQNITQGTRGGWRGVWLPNKRTNEGRRGTLLRYFAANI